jgi:hypothetical protein
MGFGKQDELTSGHGTAGKVLSVSLPRIIVSDRDGTEKTITLDNNTIIRSARADAASTTIKADDFIVVIGPMLLEKGTIDFPQPGGCVLGKRPIDFFLEGFKAFGVRVDNRDDGIHARYVCRSQDGYRACSLRRKNINSRPVPIIHLEWNCYHRTR